MEIILSNDFYTIITGADNAVFLRTKRRHIQFNSYKNFYEMSTCVMNNIEWRKEAFPELCKEQEEDGLIQAFRDFIVWYDTRKSRAKTHLRMAAKLLYWHKKSVENVWNPSNPDNHERILDIFSVKTFF